MTIDEVDCQILGTIPKRIIINEIKGSLDDWTLINVSSDPEVNIFVLIKEETLNKDEYIVASSFNKMAVLNDIKKCLNEWKAKIIEANSETKKKNNI